MKTQTSSSGVSPWDTLPTSSLITVGTNNDDTCNAGDNYLLYSWHSVPEAIQKLASTKATEVVMGYMWIVVLNQACL